LNLKPAAASDKSTGPRPPFQRVESSTSTSLDDKHITPVQTPNQQVQQSNRARVKMAASTLSLLSYLRIPIAATSAIAASLSGLLYWKQKYDSA